MTPFSGRKDPKIQGATVLATRKPKSSTRSSGELTTRLAARRPRGRSYQEPPRKSVERRDEPGEELVGPFQGRANLTVGAF